MSCLVTCNHFCYFFVHNAKQRFATFLFCIYTIHHTRPYSVWSLDMTKVSIILAHRKLTATVKHTCISKLRSLNWFIYCLVMSGQEYEYVRCGDVDSLSSTSSYESISSAPCSPAFDGDQKPPPSTTATAQKSKPPAVVRYGLCHRYHRYQLDQSSSSRWHWVSDIVHVVAV